MEKKITKKEIYAELLALEEVKSNPMYVEFIQHEIELLSRPRKRSGAPTAKQIENQKIGEEIVSIIRELGEPASVKMIKEAAPENIAELSTQKISAILRTFVNDGVLTKEMVKKVTYYSVAGE